MAVQVMAWVFEHAPKDLKPSEMLVALVLADHANAEGGLAYPSVPRMCRMTRLGERTVQGALQTLAAKGVIKRHMAANGPRPDVYCFPAFRGAGSAGVSGDRGAESAGVGRDVTPAKNDMLPPQILRKNETTPIKGTVNEPSDTPLPPKGGRSVRAKPKTHFNRQELLDSISDEEWFALQLELGVPDEWMSRTFDGLEDHYVAKGEPMADWKARWRGWCRKEVTMRGKR